MVADERDSDNYDERFASDVRKSLHSDEARFAVEDEHDEDDRRYNASIKEHEVEAAMERLDPNSSCGLDDIHNTFIINGKGLMTRSLTIMFNVFFQLGRIPTQWRHAVVTTIPKEKGAVECKRFRPISLLPTANKVMERILTAVGVRVDAGGRVFRKKSEYKKKESLFFSQ